MKHANYIVRVPDIPHTGLELEFDLESDGFKDRANAPTDSFSDESLKPPRIGLSSTPKVELFLTREGRTVQLSGRTEVEIFSSCSRCAEKAEANRVVDMNMILKPADELSRGEAEDVGLGVYSDDLLDCSQIVEEAIILELPYLMLCSDSCKGLCSQCGVNRNNVECACTTSSEDSDSPFSGLKSKLQLN